MSHQYLSLALTIGLFTAATTISAQGDTCTTALPVVTGVHLANGPTSGYAGPCGSGQDGDWYVYTPSFTGTITITSCHPLNTMADDDTYLKVLTGTCGNLTCLALNDDGQVNSCPGNSFASYLEVNVVEDENYFIVWSDAFDQNPFYWELNECVGTVTGVTYDDNNDNGTHDVGEGQLDVMLLVQPGEQYVYAGGDPYSFCTEMGAYTISVPTPPLYHNAVPTARSYEITAQGQQVTGADFAFQSIPGILDAAVDLWGWNPWIGNNTTLNLAYSNIGTEPVTATLVLELDPVLSYVSASTTATSVTGQTVTWNLGVLEEGASGVVQATIYTPPTATPNAPVMNAASIMITGSDVNAANNVDDLHGFCTTSFDPNDKQVDRETITPDQVSMQEKLEYTIRFQNTGTAPAVNVVIRDILDADLDLSTFEMVGATHPYTLSILNNEAVWTFQDIMLPDSSTDQLGSQGSLHYKAAPRATLPLGGEVSNRADIYFDFNEPVLTNTVVTSVALGTGIHGTAENTMVILPSPSNGRVTLRSTHGITGQAMVIVLDALGRPVREVSGNLQPRVGFDMDLTDLPNGTYIAWLQAEGIDARTRFVISH